MDTSLPQPSMGAPGYYPPGVPVSLPVNPYGKRSSDAHSELDTKRPRIEPTEQDFNELLASAGAGAAPAPSSAKKKKKDDIKPLVYPFTDISVEELWARAKGIGT
jgi:hypothetical protein